MQLGLGLLDVGPPLEERGRETDRQSRRGRELIVEGPPELVAKTPESYTGRFLGPLLKAGGSDLDLREPPPNGRARKAPAKKAATKAKAPSRKKAAAAAR